MVNLFDFDPGGLRVKTAIAHFKAYLQRRYPDRSTGKHYISDLTIFSQFVGNKSPRDITVKTIDAFVQAQQAAKLKPTTINRRLSAISSFFEFLIAEAEDDTWRNPVRWKRHSVRTGHHLPRDVSDDTADALLNVVHDPRDRAIFTLMLKAGLRVGEVVTLTLGDVEPPLQYNLARLRVCGKGRKERPTWLTQEAWLELAAWLQVRPESQSQALFLNQHGRPLSVSGVQYRLQRYRQQASLDLTCHQLRHTFARRLAEQHMPVDSLAKLLGHNDLQTTQLYIDGAAPTVRQDFEQAMQGLGESLPAGIDQPAASLAPGSLPAVVPSTHERPDHDVVLEQISHLTAALPAWLAQAVLQHTRRRMARWSDHRLQAETYSHLNKLCRVCRWLVTYRHWTTWEQLQRTDLVAYIHSRQEAGRQPNTIQAELIVFRAFWRDLLDQEQVTNQAILRVKAPQSSQPLPRYLAPSEFQRLLEVIETHTQTDQPDDRLNRAWFYLLAHTGLRVSELLNLRLGDCDLTGKRLRIRGGKGNQDRVVPITDKLVSVISDYVALREAAPTDHLLTFQGAALNYSLVSARLHRLGHIAGIEPLTCHRLRHTLATLLVNQGMPIASLQKLLGHRDINMTLVYAKVFDETLRQQFATAMAQIESVAIADWPIQFPISTPEICNSV
jgi:site-specific recombinase XerD